MEAEADFRQSYAGVSALLKAAPLDVQARRAVVDGGLKVIDHALRLGKLDDAGQLSAEILKLAEALFQSDGAHQGHRYRLAGSLQRAGDVALSRGQIEEAQRCFGRAMEIAESLRAASAEAPRHQDFFIALQERLGDAAVRGPYIAQALPFFDRALSLIDAQERVETGWGDLRLMMARIMRKRSIIAMKLGRTAAAKKDLDAAAAQAKALLAIEPADVAVKEELAEIAKITEIDRAAMSPRAADPPALP
jgi:tetratricopeptide (TPR) repeat protein